MRAVDRPQRLTLIKPWIKHCAIHSESRRAVALICRFGDVGFPTSEKVWREKKKETAAKYNGLLALATLQRATIITQNA